MRKFELRGQSAACARSRSAPDPQPTRESDSPARFLRIALVSIACFVAVAVNVGNPQAAHAHCWCCRTWLHTLAPVLRPGQAITCASMRCSILPRGPGFPHVFIVSVGLNVPSIALYIQYQVSIV